MKQKKHPLRDAVPLELATWLDACVLEPDTDYGKPGSPLMRKAWAGQVHHDEVLPTVDEWVERQTEVQLAAQLAYERLVALEPVRDASGTMAAWFPTWWAEVLLGMPWDERLEDAVLEATSYCLTRSE